MRYETVKDYALRTGVTEKTVCARIKRGELQAEKHLTPADTSTRGWYWVISTPVEYKPLKDVSAPTTH